MDKFFKIGILVLGVVFIIILNEYCKLNRYEHIGGNIDALILDKKTGVIYGVHDGKHYIFDLIQGHSQISDVIKLSSAK